MENPEEETPSISVARDGEMGEEEEENTKEETLSMSVPRSSLTEFGVDGGVRREESTSE